MPSLLYLHGFLSSPLSFKAQQTSEFARRFVPQCQVHIPELSNVPRHLESQLRACAEQMLSKDDAPLRVIGSSMGGYLATWLTQQYGGTAVLINPAVRPYELLENYLGEHVNPYTQQAFSLTQDDLPIIKQFAVTSLVRPENYWVLLQTGDEVLDYRDARKHYQQAKVTVIEGGDHSFIDYSHHLPELFRFLQLM